MNSLPCDHARSDDKPPWQQPPDHYGQVKSKHRSRKSGNFKQRRKRNAMAKASRKANRR